MSLKIDHCSFEAAKYAVMNWHYSKAMPSGKLIKYGVWEDNTFIGAVIYGRGANNNMLKTYGLKSIEGCELVRIALNKHVVPVTKIMSITIRMLKKQNPGLRIIASYADDDQDHVGSIYQANNWIYTGKTSGVNTGNFIVNGNQMHGRSVSEKFGTASIEKLMAKGINIKKHTGKGKFKYIYPLDKQMMNECMKLSKDYPKRLKQAMADIPISTADERHIPNRSNSIGVM